MVAVAPAAGDMSRSTRTGVEFPVDDCAATAFAPNSANARPSAHECVVFGRRRIILLSGSAVFILLTVPAVAASAHALTEETAAITAAAAPAIALPGRARPSHQGSSIVTRRDAPPCARPASIARSRSTAASTTECTRACRAPAISSSTPRGEPARLVRAWPGAEPDRPSVRPPHVAADHEPDDRHADASDAHQPPGAVPTPPRTLSRPACG